MLLTLTGLVAQPGGGSAAASPSVLDLSRYKLTFEEKFDNFSVSPWGPVKTSPTPGFTRWIAHTPWNGDFGDAKFSDPEKDFPFTVTNGVLRIEARKDADGKWRSGLLASTDPKGNGFSQRGGYFEMRAKLPSGPGVWPSFWLDGNQSHDASAEVDVMEYYGQFPNVYQVTSHVWPKVKSVKYSEVKQFVHVPPGSLSNQFHTYGVDVNSKLTTYYLDGLEVSQTPTPPENNQPMFILVDLALGSGWPIDKTPNPSFMYVQFIRAYEKVK